MKKAILILCLAFLLTACDNNNNENENSDTTTKATTTTAETTDTTNETTTTIKVDPLREGLINISAKKATIKSILSDEEISKLNTSKNGYGQGVQFDEMNRPLAALLFNSQFEKYDSYAITNQENTVYLTFDQGYENGYTTVILDTLKDKNVKATFFILKDYAVRNKELVQRMIDEGHIIGNHSLHHYSMPTLDIEASKQELIGLHKYMQDEFGYEMNLFRPPMGEYSEQSLAIAQACGYKTVLWSYAYADWDVNKQMEPSKALEKVTKASHSGCIYLLHSVSKTNSEILPEVINSLISKGYSFGIPDIS